MAKANNTKRKTHRKELTGINISIGGKREFHDIVGEYTDKTFLQNINGAFFIQNI